jgi:hypothetical protein
VGDACRDSGSYNAISAEAQLPKDVHPESLNRLPLITREELDPAGQKLYDSYATPDSISLSGLNKLCERTRRMHTGKQFDT